MARGKRKRTSGNDFTNLPEREDTNKPQQLLQEKPSANKDNKDNKSTRLGAHHLQIGHRKSLISLSRRAGIDSLASSRKNSNSQSPLSPVSTRLVRQGETGKVGTGSLGDFSSPAFPKRFTPLRQGLHHKNSPLQHAHGNLAAVSKLRYLEKIAAWAAAKVPSLGALYGVRLKRTSEASGISSPVLDSLCERCQTVLLPFVNCSVKSPKDKRRRRRRRSSQANVGPSKALQNLVPYRCHYCNHDNWKSDSLQQEAKSKSAQASARAQMVDEAKIYALNSNSSCIQEGQVSTSTGASPWTVVEVQCLSKSSVHVHDDDPNHSKDRLRVKLDSDAERIPSQNDTELSCCTKSNEADEQNPALSQTAERTCTEADNQFATPPASCTSRSGLPSSTTTDSQVEKPSTKKRKRKGWTSLKAIATSSLEKILPKPKRLGFALHQSSPIHARQPK